MIFADGSKLFIGLFGVFDEDTQIHIIDFIILLHLIICKNYFIIMI
jgi:hypothetical membrane protein